MQNAVRYISENYDQELSLREFLLVKYGEIGGIINEKKKEKKLY